MTSMRKVRGVLGILTAAAGILSCAGETILRAGDVLSETNVDWTALARAERLGKSGAPVAFELSDRTRATYQQMRRELWLAALHGLTNIVCRDPQSRTILSGELARATKAARRRFAIEVAVRDVSTGGDLIPLLVRTQTAAELVGTNDCAHPIVLRCQGTEAIGEKSGLAFTSLATAVSFARSCQSATDFICEEDGDLATDVFIRRFTDGSSIVLNLQDNPRPGLVYRRGRKRLKFDFQAGDVIELKDSVPDPFTHETDEPFISELWKVSFASGDKPRVAPADNVGNVVDENYFGPIVYATTASIPAGTDVILKLETGNEAAEVFLDGKNLGTRAWEPFEWRIQGSSRTRRAQVEIHLEKRTRLGFLLAAPTWRRL